MDEPFSLGNGLEPQKMTVPSLLVALLLGAPAAPASDSTPAAPAAPVASTAPAAAPSAAPLQLREIGRVRATVCGNIVVHANSAIASALKNDIAMVSAIQRLRSVDLERDPLAFHHGLNDLDELAVQLHDNAIRGDGEVQRLRDLAATTKDPQRKAELRAFADALGGALYRQKQTGMDLGGLVTFLQARDMRQTPDLDQTEASSSEQGLLAARNDTASIATPFTTWADTHGTPRQMTQMAAVDFAAREQAIAIEEGTAADHAEGAVSGC